MKVRVPLIGAVLAFAWNAPGAAEPPPNVFATTLRIDGVRTDVHAFESPEDPEELARGYAAAWRRERPGEPVLDSAAGAWRVVGQRDGGRYRTAQFGRLQSGRTRVVLASRELPKRPVPAESPIGLPFGSRVLRTVESTAGDRRAVQIVARVDLAPEAVTRRLRATAEGEAWRYAHATSGRAGHASAWERDGDELLIVVVPAAGGSSVLLHLDERTAGGGR
jgi:hypothetical protein